MRHVAVIDYGMGNLRSASKALETVAQDAVIEVTSDPEQILKASHVLFPGVGAIRDCIAELKRRGLDEVIYESAKTKPFLAICIGMQALLTHSEENGGIDSLNLIPGKVKKFNDHLDRQQADFKVPHMGWNQVQQTVSHPLWQNIEQASRFYFVHSYYTVPDDASVIAATARYQHDFTAALHRDNIFAVQFHPEKSHHAGLQLLQNFINWDGQS